MEHVTQTRQLCGHPNWTLKTKEQQIQKREIKEKRKNADKSKGVVTNIYVKRMTEHVQRMLNNYKIVSAVRRHINIRRILVHPTDKVERQAVSTRSHARADITYVGETRRMFEKDSVSTSRRSSPSQPNGLSVNRRESH